MQFSSVRHQQKNKRKRFLEAVWRNVDVLEKPLTDMDVSVDIRYQVTHSQNLRVRPKKKKKLNRCQMMTKVNAKLRQLNDEAIKLVIAIKVRLLDLKFWLISVCVCVRVCVYVRVRACVCNNMYVRIHVRVYVCVCARARGSCNVCVCD